MKKQDFIEKVRVNEPCAQEWNEMIGNDQVRFCTHCAREVNNLSTMTRKEALRIVRKSEGRLCIRYIPDPETGAPVFGDQLIKIARRAPRMATGVMSAALSLAGVGYAQGGASKAAVPQPVARFEEKSCPDKPGETDKQARTSESLGSVTGTITDPNGAVIPSVSVALLDEKNNTVKKAATDEDGRYVFDSIKPGVYSVSAEMRFFKDGLASNIAVSDGRAETVNMSLEIGELVSIGGVMVSTEPEYTGKLAIAVAKDEIDEVRNLIAAGEDVNGREEDRTTPLFIAVENGNVEMVLLLLDFGAKVNARNEDKETPLMKLDEDASRQLVEVLIRAGAKVDAESEEGNTPLMYAAEYSTADVVKALIDAGADLDKQNEEGVSALMKAAAAEDLAKVQALVFAGAAVNLRDKDGDNAWDYTAEEEIEGFLVAHGVIVDVDDEKEITADDGGPEGG